MLLNVSYLEKHEGIYGCIRTLRLGQAWACLLASSVVRGFQISNYLEKSIHQYLSYKIMYEKSVQQLVRNSPDNI